MECNVPRIRPANVDVYFDVKDMPIPPIFKVLVEKGNVDKVEAYRVFNMGIGMVWFVPAAEADAAIKICRECGFVANKVGEITEGSKTVHVK